MKKIVCLFFVFMAALFASASGMEGTNKDDSRYFVAVTKIDYDEAKAKLGKKLFFDKRLSEDGRSSCESCHNLYWDFSGTVRHVEDGVLDPVSVLSVGLNYMFFNDGKIRSIYDQIDRSITSIDELATDPKRLAVKLSKIDEYTSAFSKVYPTGLNYENIRDALVEFEKSITSVNSPFDRYLLGDVNALSPEQKKGLALFKDVGCVACHNGVNLGSNVEQIVNFYEFVVKSEHNETSDLADDAKNHFIHPPKDGNEVDVFLCKHSITGKFYKPRLDFMRIPPLRNIARTRPYYRCGKKTSLQQTIQDMSKIQLNYDLSDDDAELIYKFLLSLDGEIPRILK
ncbi:cytochrome-c peroxidase [Campylobacter sp. 19-13652]|uniref:cytochrome-c peroxidase n=1 Tax=Campylobacter sp. 19-13652 TaxID=2840180 RepID=UPI001C74C90C|nr:cytochrome c peroxidase [Campylobacter sp. 19-13652]BCX78849.1 cytochrome b6 [Campylobacter sp. 19-13652]